MKPTYEELEEQLNRSRRLCDAALANERVWETAMMKACGEDGPKSVADKFAELEAKCAALAAELKQSQIDAGCYKKGMEASNERLVQVAAENAALKDFLHSRVDESICDKHIKTPATDAYRDELRAQGIEMAAKSDQFSMWVQQGLRSFAIGVRQGDEK